MSESFSLRISGSANYRPESSGKRVQGHASWPFGHECIRPLSPKRVVEGSVSDSLCGSLYVRVCVRRCACVCVCVCVCGVSE